MLRQIMQDWSHANSIQPRSFSLSLYVLLLLLQCNWFQFPNKLTCLDLTSILVKNIAFGILTPKPVCQSKLAFCEVT